MADRRSERTRSYLRGALLDLLQDKPLERLTLKEVVERAQVSKNTFYNYYTGLPELAQDCFFNELVFFRPPYKRLADYPCKRDAAFETIEQQEALLVFYRKNPNLAKAILFNEAISPYFSQISEADRDLLTAQVEFEYGYEKTHTLQAATCVEFAVQGILGTMRRWVMIGMPGDTAVLARDIVYLALQCTAAIVGRAIEPEYLQAIEDWNRLKGL